MIGAAGNVQHDQILDLVSRRLPDPTAQQTEFDSVAPRIAAPILIERKNELEQAHLIVASPWPSAKSSDRYAASMLGRLSAVALPAVSGNQFAKSGDWLIRLAQAEHLHRRRDVYHLCRHVSGHLDQVLDLSLSEIRRIVREPVSEDELQFAKEQATSSVLLSLESSSSRVSALAREIIHGRRISPEEIIQSVTAVTRDDVQRVAQSCFTTPTLALGALGNLNGFKVDRARLEI